MKQMKIEVVESRKFLRSENEAITKEAKIK